MRRRVSANTALTVLQIGHELEYNVLHGAIIADVMKWMALMNDNITGWARVVLFEMLDQAAFTNCSEVERERDCVTN